MTQTGWYTSDLEGRRLRRVFKRLEKELEKAKTPHELCEIAKAMAYVAQSKTTLAKLDWDDLDKRLAEVEKLYKV